MKSGWLIIGITATLFSACAGIQKRTDIVPVQDIALEKVDGDRVIIEGAQLIKDQRGLRVEGSAVERTSHGRFRESGHIDMSLYNPDGNVGQTSVIPLNSWSISSFGRNSRFLIQLPSDVNPGSKVRIRFHSTVATINTSPHDF